jgi:hypothetical protein
VFIDVYRSEFQNKGWVIPAGITRWKLSPFDAGNVVGLMMVFVMLHGVDA